MARKSWHTHIKRASRERRTSPDSDRVFHSLAERRRFDELNQLQRLGMIRNLRCQVSFPLERPDLQICVKSPTGRAVLYVADFVYEAKGEKGQSTASGPVPCDYWGEVIEDVKQTKGHDKLSALKIAVAEALHGIKVTIHNKKTW
jgi:hypothetical protein